MGLVSPYSERPDEDTKRRCSFISRQERAHQNPTKLEP